MSQNIVLTFALLFGAVIALICSVYVALTHRREARRQFIDELKKELINSN